MTEITVMPHKFVEGWPSHETGEPVAVLDLGDALTRTYTTDAHFCAYRTPIARRLNRDSIQHQPVELTVVAFDVDGPDHKTSPVWLRETRDRVQALAEEHPGLFYFETRGGARIVYRQGEPAMLRSQDDAVEWRQAYAVMVAYLARRFAIVADGGCDDWQRCYRLPYVVRDGEPENRPTWGDPYAIGALEIHATEEDVAVARCNSRAFHSVKIRPVASTAIGDGYGVLYHALKARGDVVADHTAGSFIVRCPREKQHTTGVSGDTSCVLYLPDAGEELGHIHCKHAHCVNLGPKEWLGEFSESELDAARGRAGVQKRTAA